MRYLGGLKPSTASQEQSMYKPPYTCHVVTGLDQCVLLLHFFPIFPKNSNNLIRFMYSTTLAIRIAQIWTSLEEETPFLWSKHWNSALLTWGEQYMWIGRLSCSFDFYQLLSLYQPFNSSLWLHEPEVRISGRISMTRSIIVLNEFDGDQHLMTSVLQCPECEVGCTWTDGREMLDPTTTR